MKYLASCLLAGCCFAPGPLLGQTVAVSPCLFNEYFPEWRCFPAILQDAEGNLTCGKHRLTRGGVTSAPPAGGRVCATSARFTDEPGPQLRFCYRDRAGGIQELWHTRKGEKDTWHSLMLTAGGATSAPPAVGNPSGGFFEMTYHVVYRDAAGQIQDLSSERDGPWEARALNDGGSTEALPAAGDPVQMVMQGARHVVYRDVCGQLQDLWFDGGWHAQVLNLGGVTEAPSAAGEPAGLEGPGTAHQVVYRDQDGQVQAISFDGKWHSEPLTVNGLGTSRAPLAAGDPALMIMGDHARHVIYRDRQGGIQDLWFDTVWHVRKLNAGGETSAPPARSEPSLLVPPSQCEYVGYVDIHGEGQLLSHYPKKKWVVLPLNANTPP